MLLVSSVYTKVTPFDGEPVHIYSPELFYPNLSCIFEQRSITTLLRDSEQQEKTYSEVKAAINHI